MIYTVDPGIPEEISFMHTTTAWNHMPFTRSILEFGAVARELTLAGAFASGHRLLLSRVRLTELPRHHCRPARHKTAGPQVVYGYGDVRVIS